MISDAHRLPPPFLLDARHSLMRSVLSLLCGDNSSEGPIVAVGDLHESILAPEAYCLLEVAKVQRPHGFLGELARDVASGVETTGHPIEQIAGEVGFGSPTSFRDLFENLVGTSPRDYRRAFRGSRATLNLRCVMQSAR